MRLTDSEGMGGELHFTATIEQTVFTVLAKGQQLSSQKKTVEQTPPCGDS